MITITVGYGRHSQKEEYKVRYTVARSVSKILYCGKELDKARADYLHSYYKNHVGKKVIK